MDPGLGRGVYLHVHMCVHARMRVQGGADVGRVCCFFLPIVRACCQAVGCARGFLSRLDSQEEVFRWPQAEQPDEPGQEEIYLAGASREVPRDIQ